eukprot:gene2874-3165_t
MHKLDSVDNGLDVSMTELDEHLHQVLKGVKLSDWIAHGLGLPQHADAFERNGITVLDFPLLVKHGGQLLETELQLSHDGVPWFYDTPAPGQYQYRLAAWNPYGRSGYTLSDQVTVAPIGAVQRPAARLAAAAGVAAGGVVGSAGRGGAKNGDSRCTQLFDLRHLKALMGRHYCGRCQQAFCIQHTAYSPHGSTGSCGAESRCVCITCFYDFTPEYRMFLSSRNTLISRRTSSGPARQESIPGLRGSFKSIAAAASGVTARRQQQDSITAVSSLEGWDSTTAEGTRLNPPCSGCCTAGDEAMFNMEQSCGEDPGSKCPCGRQLISQDAVDTAYELPSVTLRRANRVRSVLLWGRAWAKASAVVRFKRAAELTQINSNQPALAQ